MRGLTRVIDRYPEPKDFASAVNNILAASENPVLPTTVAVLLGVPEVSLRNMITDDDYGATVERLYMTALASCVEYVITSDSRASQALMAVLKDLFGWFGGCADFLQKASVVVENDNLALERLLEEVAGGG